MKLTNLKRASYYEVERWLEKKLNLSPYQKDKLDKEEILRFSPFEFYKPDKKEKIFFLWRLTIIVFPIYLLVIFSFLPVKMIFQEVGGMDKNFMIIFIPNGYVN